MNYAAALTGPRVELGMRETESLQGFVGVVASVVEQFFHGQDERVLEEPIRTDSHFL